MLRHTGRLQSEPTGATPRFRPDLVLQWPVAQRKREFARGFRTSLHYRSLQAFELADPLVIRDFRIAFSDDGLGIEFRVRGLDLFSRVPYPRTNVLSDSGTQAKDRLDIESDGADDGTRVAGSRSVA